MKKCQYCQNDEKEREKLSMFFSLSFDLSLDNKEDMVYNINVE